MRLKSYDGFFVFNPSSWLHETQDLHSFGNTTVCSTLQIWGHVSIWERHHCEGMDALKTDTEKHLAASSVYDLVHIVETSCSDAYGNKLVKLSHTALKRCSLWELILASEHNQNQIQISSVTSSSLSPDAHSRIRKDHRDIWPKVSCWPLDGNG